MNAENGYSTDTTEIEGLPSEEIVEGGREKPMVFINRSKDHLETALFRLFATFGNYLGMPNTITSFRRLRV